MKRTGIAVGTVLSTLMLAAPMAAPAASMDYLDAYYIPDSTLEIEGANGNIGETENGDGFGVKLATMLGEHIFLAGEFQSTSGDMVVRLPNNTTASGESTLETTRIGLGWNTGTPFYLLGEYIRNKYELEVGQLGDSTSEDGFGVHLGVKLDVLEYLTLEARGGYLNVGDNGGEGYEYLAGLGLNLDRNFGLFIDYRVTDLENDDDGSAKAEDLRAGFRFRF